MLFTNNKKVKTFNGGIHPDIDKNLLGEKKFIILPLPEKVRIPLLQHIGASAKPIVKVGDFVKTGQVIGEASGFVSCPVHASISGKVTAVKTMPVALFKKNLCIEIESDGKDEKNWVEEKRDWRGLDSETIRNLIFSAGISGMGGAGFPTHVKLSPPKEKPIKFVIINGVECEPYLDSDRQSMCENPDKVIEGLLIAMKTVGCDKGYIGIEANKPNAIAKIQSVAAQYPQIEVITLEVKYPQGAEKQLIYAVSKIEVPQGGLPMDAGALVLNAGTAVAISEAVVYGKPLIERVTTIAGNCLREPLNVRVRIGSIINDVIARIGGFAIEPSKAVMGGPMMGEALFNADTPIVKTTSGLLFLTEKETIKYGMQPCIRCGKCVDICPMGISPAKICQAVEFERYSLADKMGLLYCIKCGCCSYVCPSRRELVQLIKIGEQYLKKIKDKKN